MYPVTLIAILKINPYSSQPACHIFNKGLHTWTSNQTQLEPHRSWPPRLKIATTLKQHCHIRGRRGLPHHGQEWICTWQIQKYSPTEMWCCWPWHTLHSSWMANTIAVPNYNSQLTSSAHWVNPSHDEHGYDKTAKTLTTQVPRLWRLCLCNPTRPTPECFSQQKDRSDFQPSQQGLTLPLPPPDYDIVQNPRWTTDLS